MEPIRSWLSQGLRAPEVRRCDKRIGTRIPVGRAAQGRAANDRGHRPSRDARPMLLSRIPAREFARATYLGGFAGVTSQAIKAI